MLEYEIKSKSALQKRRDPRGTVRDLPSSINPYQVPLFFVFLFLISFSSLFFIFLLLLVWMTLPKAWESYMELSPYSCVGHFSSPTIGRCLATIWLPLGHFLAAATIRSFDHHLATVRPIIATTWALFGRFLADVWPPHCRSAAPIWPSLCHCSVATWPLFCQV